MTRNELRGYVKKWFNSRGFQSQKSYLFKVLDGDYLLGFCCKRQLFAAYYFDRLAVFLTERGEVSILDLISHFDFKRNVFRGCIEQSDYLTDTVFRTLVGSKHHCVLSVLG